MEKINLVELLKDCPKGMEFDCTNYNGVVRLNRVMDDNSPYPIEINVVYGDECNVHTLTKYGQTVKTPYNKCIIFPKGKTTWEGFVPPCKFKDGDIIYNQCIKATAIFCKQTNNGTISHCFLNSFNELIIQHHHCKITHDWRFATEEEQEKLFHEIKKNGYQWNADAKILGKLFKPRFKVGDRIIGKYTKNIYTISCITEKGYELTDGTKFDFDSEDCFIVSNKFDITTLKPFAQVLARCSTLEKWRIQFFEKYDKDCKFPFICMGYNKYNQCIPYENNEYLLDTADSCDEFYKNW